MTNSYLMEQSMRWFGPKDPVSLWDIRQAGATSVVTALHDVPNGQVWPKNKIAACREVVEHAGLSWNVVESLPVHEDIKRQRGDFKKYIENYKKTIANIAACGISVVTYNFMPVLDWTRTDLGFELPDKSKALRFEMTAIAAFDKYILNRKIGPDDYTDRQLELGKKRFAAMKTREKKTIARNIIAGLPGSEESFSIAHFKKALNGYQHVTADDLRSHLYYFLRQIIPVAEQENVKMVIHPDDPPFPIFGLPRVVSTAGDIRKILHAAPSPYNGLCLCTGSLGVLSENDIPSMVSEFGDQINFVHLRNIKRNKQGDFYEADHLLGDIDMYSTIKAILAVMQNRKLSISMRPDHGHQMLHDLKKKVNPGYSAIGRLRGLSELRGLELGISRSIID